MDNLHRFLAPHDPNTALYFGRLFVAGKTRYYSGGSGIVLSRGALFKIGKAMGGSEEAAAWAGAHPRGMGPEDMLTSKTLLPLGVLTQESVDEHGRQLFMAMGT
jgi:hypothetical protein